MAFRRRRRRRLVPRVGLASRSLRLCHRRRRPRCCGPASRSSRSRRPARHCQRPTGFSFRPCRRWRRLGWRNSRTFCSSPRRRRRPSPPPPPPQVGPAVFPLVRVVLLLAARPGRAAAPRLLRRFSGRVAPPARPPRIMIGLLCHDSESESRVTPAQGPLPGHRDPAAAAVTFKLVEVGVSKRGSGPSDSEPSHVSHSVVG